MNNRLGRWVTRLVTCSTPPWTQPSAPRFLLFCYFFLLNLLCMFHMEKQIKIDQICFKDCDRLKKHKFAKDCKNRGGLYKCCIRRDKAFCHECRYLVWIKWKQISITCKGSAVHYPFVRIHPHTTGPMETQTVFLTTG